MRKYLVGVMHDMVSAPSRPNCAIVSPCVIMTIGVTHRNRTRGPPHEWHGAKHLIHCFRFHERRKHQKTLGVLYQASGPPNTVVMTCVMQFSEPLRVCDRNQRCFGKECVGDIMWPTSMIKNELPADSRHLKSGNECVLGDVYSGSDSPEENARVKVMMGRIK